MGDGNPELRVQLSKHADGGAVLRCVRRDGSATWQRHDGPRAAFFPFHDLTHLAVESVLGFRQGFFGLLANGWNLEDTGGKGTRGRLPGEAEVVEHVVGLFDQGRAGAADPLSAAELNEVLAGYVAQGRFAAARTVTDPELAAVRACIAELHHQWVGVPPGGTLELAFDRHGSKG
jgi:hypothetical protein